MAIQIQGNTVITDSRDFQNLTTLNGFFIGVQTPSITSPADAATDQNKTVTITSSAFGAGIISETHVSSDWELATDSNFNTIVQSNIANTSNKTSWTTGDLDVSTTYYARVRYNGTRTTSQYANTVSFTTKATFAPTVLGQSYNGGYYVGTIDIGSGNCYYLITAPTATGRANCQWKTITTPTGSLSCVNGYLNTYTYMQSSLHPAGNWAATRSIDGYSDWYMPAKDEMLCFYCSSLCIANAPDRVQTGATCRYWTSTERGSVFPQNGQGCFLSGVNGTFSYYSKAGSRLIQAFRREPI